MYKAYFGSQCLRASFARLPLNVQCWCRVYIQCRKRNRNGGRDDLLLNCHIGCKKPTADRDLIALKGFLALLQDKFMSKWWHWSELEPWYFTIKTFKTCQCNESRLVICRLKSEHNCSGKNARNKHVSWVMLYKQGALKYLYIETRLLFPFLLKFLATCLVATASIYQNLVVCFCFDVCDLVVYSSSTFYFGTDQIWVDYYRWVNMVTSSKRKQ